MLSMMSESTANTIRTYVVEELLDDDTPIEDSARLFELGLIDSMNLVRLLSFLEETFEVRIPVSMVTDDNFASIDTMVDLIHQVKT